MTWATDRPGFQARLDTINNANPSPSSALATLHNTISSYIESGGLQHTDDSHPAYAGIMTQINGISAIKDRYTTLHNDITSNLTSAQAAHDLQATMKKIGEKKTDIQRLKDLNKKLDSEVESALARDELLRSRSTHRNSHTLFLLDRPVKKQMIPVLWVLSILFIGVALILIKMNMPIPSGSDASTGVAFSMILGFILQPPVLVTLLGVCIIVIIFLSLKIAGVIP